MTDIIVLILNALSFLILAEVVISWLEYARLIRTWKYPAIGTLRTVVQPILSPLRRAMPPASMGGLDLSPMLALIIIQVIIRLLGR